MSDQTVLVRSPRKVLAADAALIGAGFVSTGLALSYAAWWVLGRMGAADVVGGVFGGILLWVCGIAGVVVPWLLSGRRITGITVVGGLAGGVAAGVVVPIVAGTSALLGWVISPLTRWEFAGPVAMLALISLAFVAVIAWLMADAIRDMSPEKRHHLRLDIARIAAALPVALVAVGSAIELRGGGAEAGEAIIWAMAGGLIAAVTVTIADLVVSYAAAQKSKAAPAESA